MKKSESNSYNSFKRDKLTTFKFSKINIKRHITHKNQKNNLQRVRGLSS